ncbi:hypothetical protein IWX48DRAFT_596084 [Phyllosticta citricarpa]
MHRQAARRAINQSAGGGGGGGGGGQVGRGTMDTTRHNTTPTTPKEMESRQVGQGKPSHPPTITNTTTTSLHYTLRREHVCACLHAARLEISSSSSAAAAREGRREDKRDTVLHGTGGKKMHALPAAAAAVSQSIH